MVTPIALVGRTNPRTGRPHGREIRDLKQARKLRDLRLGKIRLEEALNTYHGSLEQALLIAAEEIEARAGIRKASRWYKTARGLSTPLKDLCEQYKADAGRRST
ncbi:MAG: hypothetical protein RLZZ501_2519 [Pseudomonadota bacterium]|jgi:hypothetical protein